MIFDLYHRYCQTTGLPPAQDHEDTTPFQCNGQNQPGGSDKPSSEDRSKLNTQLIF